MFKHLMSVQNFIKKNNYNKNKIKYLLKKELNKENL
jgi:hypothetical protein